MPKSDRNTLFSSLGHLRKFTLTITWSTVTAVLDLLPSVTNAQGVPKVWQTVGLLGDPKTDTNDSIVRNLSMNILLMLLVSLLVLIPVTAISDPLPSFDRVLILGTPRAVQDAELTDQNENPFMLSSLRGKGCARIVRIHEL